MTKKGKDPGKDPNLNGTKEGIKSIENNFSLREGWNKLSDNERLILGRDANKEDSETTSRFKTKNLNGYDLITNTVTVLNPALDFYDDKLILTLPFIWNKPLLDDDKSIKGHKPEITNFALILPDRDFFLLNEAQLLNRKLFAKPPSGTFPQRWSTKSFLDFFEHGKTINPYDVFKEIKNKYDYFMDYGDRQSSVTTYKAAYIIMSYFHPLFNYLGYNKLEGDTGSGKTKSAMLDLQLGFNAISSIDASPAAIFRIIQERRATLIVDEFEGYAIKDPDNLQILSILNAGFQKGLTVLRIEMKGAKGNLLESSPFSPKTIASIDPAYETLRNRSHLIRSVKTLDKTKSNEEVDINDPKWQSVRDDLYLLLVNYYTEVKKLSNEKYDDWNLDSRDLNKAKPILTIIRFISNYAGEDSKKLVNDIKEFFEDQKAENKELGTESFEATIINRLEILVENLIANKHEIKRNEKDLERFNKEMAEFNNENIEISIPAISEAIALDSGIDIDSSRHNKISYSKKISHKLKAMGLKKNPKITHNNVTVFYCSLRDIQNAKIRYGLVSGQSILPNLPIQPIPSIQPIQDSSIGGIESRDSIDRSREERDGTDSHTFNCPGSPTDSKEPEKSNVRSGEWQYFRVRESFSYGKYTYEKGKVSKFPTLEAAKYIEKGLLELPCLHSQVWDANERQCISNGEIKE